MDRWSKCRVGHCVGERELHPVRVGGNRKVVSGVLEVAGCTLCVEFHRCAQPSRRCAWPAAPITPSAAESRSTSSVRFITATTGRSAVPRHTPRRLQNRRREVLAEVRLPARQAAKRRWDGWSDSMSSRSSPGSANRPSARSESRAPPGSTAMPIAVLKSRSIPIFKPTHTKPLAMR